MIESGRDRHVKKPPSLADGADDHAGWEGGGQVLEAVHQEVDATVLQRRLQLLREQILLTDLWVCGTVQGYNVWVSNRPGL